MIHRVWRGFRGNALYSYYADYLRQVSTSIPSDTVEDALRRLLDHARREVPYYADLMASPPGDPFEALSALPLLSKETIRSEFDRLQSRDLNSRRWRFNTSGGSTGEPVRLIQDAQFTVSSEAIQLLYSHLVGRDFGQSMMRLWGSERDILEGGVGLMGRLRAWGSNTTTVNAFRMSTGDMRNLAETLNSRPPHLVLAYAQAAYEFAMFIEREGIAIRPQRAVMTSAGTLYSFMREAIERVFGCRVFNKYGSREVGDLACEIPECDGMWVAPWGVHIEVLDDSGLPVHDGQDGELVVTLLTNYAMPLIRYRIGDRGALAPRGQSWHGNAARVLLRVTGRTVDAFRLRDGTIVDGEYFTHLLYFRDWVASFQVIQRGYDDILVRIVPHSETPLLAEQEIVNGVIAAMGPGCAVEFEYCDRMAPSASGKYRYTISQVD